MSKIAFMFPGQGAQTAGMGKDFYEHSEIARNIIDRSSGLLKLDMKSLCFEENENLHQTEYTQAALVTVCMAMEQVLRTSGVKPDVTAGLSLGENREENVPLLRQEGCRSRMRSWQFEREAF